MAVIVSEEGEAFSLSEEDYLEFLEMRAAGGTAELADYAVGIGDFGHDLTGLDRTRAFQLAAALRVDAAQTKAA